MTTNRSNLHRPAGTPGTARRPGRMPLDLAAALALLCLSRSTAASEDGAGGVSRIEVIPPSLSLRGQGARQQLLVTGHSGDTRIDLTREAVFESQAQGIARVDPKGVVTAGGTGETRIRLTARGLRAELTVSVTGGESPPPVTLEGDVLPVLTRHHCNSGPCHGKARGQNGFQLSLLGFDPDFDYRALVQEGRGRRVFPADAGRSLLLAKPAGRIAHGGGLRLPEGSGGHGTISRWISSGFPRRREDSPRLSHVTVEPSHRRLRYHEPQQLIVTAHHDDGHRLDVTHLATFQSSESPIAGVDGDGLVRAGPIAGEAAIMVRYRGHIAVSKISIPRPGEVPSEVYSRLPRRCFIDDLVWKKLRTLGITPSGPAGDATFLRRATIDVLGRLPTPEETRSFLADGSPGRRERLVDWLLEQPEYADAWANRWADLLRPNPYRVGIKAVFNLDAWLRDAFRRNLPYDEFVREIITAQGSTFRHGPATIFRDRRSPDELATLTSRLFLGIRLECARCHHHPFETWSQGDFYGFAAYFARVGRKGTGLSPPISGGEEIIFVADRGEVRHPRTGEILAPSPLFGDSPPVTQDRDPRESLAAWMLGPASLQVARVQVNRIWADLMGRGIVEPVDDLRATNPPSNEELLDTLARHFRDGGYDVKALLRTILTSEVYGLSSRPTARNSADTRNYSRHYRQRLRAEVLLDAVCAITGIRDDFAAMPPQSRATEIWTHRSPSIFLDTFGRPDPNQDPPCERLPEASVVQALHLMNAEAIHRKVTSEEGRAARLAASRRSMREILEELYLLAYCRLPTEDELREGERICTEVYDLPGFGQGNDRGAAAAVAARRRRATEDLLWALLNTPEFIFKD